MKPRRETMIWLGLAVPILLLLAFANWRSEVFEESRPNPDDLLVVSKSHSDPIWRPGLRRLAGGEDFRLGLAVRYRDSAGDSLWLVPSGVLEIDGVAPPQRAGEWPEEDRELGGRWISFESYHLAPTEVVDFEHPLRMQRFLRPDWGSAMEIDGLLDPGNDDFLGRGHRWPAEFGKRPGTLRICATMQLYRPFTKTRDVELRSPCTLDLQRTAVISRSAPPSAPIPAIVGEQFHLPLAPAVDDELFEALVATTVDRAFEAVGSGLPTRWVEIVPDEDDRLFAAGAALRWEDLAPGARVRDSEQQLVLLADDGNGFVDADDWVLQAWRGPLGLVHLGDALGEVGPWAVGTVED